MPLFPLRRRLPLLLLSGLLGLLPPLAPEAVAQQAALNTAPQMIGLRLDVFPDADARQAFLLFSRQVPVTLLLPEVAADSHFDILFGAAGARFGEGHGTRFRWRAGVLDLNLMRPPFVVGFTLVDFDRSGVPDLHARWLGLRLGPALRFGTSRLALEPRLVGHGAVSTLKLGRFHYAALGDAARVTRAGLEGGYTATLMLRLGRRLSLKASRAHRVHTGGPDPTTRTRSLSLLYTPESRLALFALLAREETSIGAREVTFEHLRVGIRFVPGMAGL